MPSYLDLEKSGYNGRPQEFYHFFRAGEDWFLTPGMVTIILGGVDGGVYTPSKVTRDEIEGGGEDAPGSLKVRIPASHALAQSIMDGRSDPAIELRLMEYHRGAEYDTPITFWGEVATYDRDGAFLDIECQPTQAQGEMVVPRLLYQKDECGFSTYDPSTCGVDPADFTYVGNITAIDGLKITVGGAEAAGVVEGEIDPDYFTGGVLSKGNRKGLIEKQVGDDIYLQYLVKGIIVGDSVSLLAGDDRTKETCLHKFGNIGRNFSFSLMPELTPWFGQGLRS